MKNRINKSRLIYIAMFFGVVFFVLSVTDKIIRAKFIGDSTTIVNGFYAEKKNDIDVIVIGSSNSFCTVNPIVLYDQYGIAAYDFGSSSQPMNISALYLKEALKRQKPKVVALEVNMMTGGSINTKNESAFRWGYTDIPLSFDKLKCVYQSLGCVDAEYFSYVFPVFRYHDRWKELSKIDYTYFFGDKINYTKGYLETQSVTELAVSLSDYNIDGETWLEEENITYLDEMAALCKKNGVELLLFKSPREDWHRYDTEAIRELAQERGLLFLDYNELYHDGSIVLDTVADFRDGEHLNDFGAQKVSVHFGRFLQENYDLPDRRGGEEQNSWDLASLYCAHKGQKAYMEAQNAHDCLALLQGDSNYIIMVTEKVVKGKNPPEQWVYKDGRVVLHKVWEEDGREYMDVEKSKVVFSKQGVAYHVLIDGIEYYQLGNRWNIIVYDKVTQEITALAFSE